MLKELRELKNLDQQQLAKALRMKFGGKWAQADISRYERGIIEPPDARVRQMAEFLGVRPSLLRGEEFSEEISVAIPINGDRQPSPSRSKDGSRAYQFGPDTVPILGHANGSPDAVIISMDNEVGRALRHPNQDGLKDSFALYAVGESMSPRYMPGELVYAVANKPPMRGTDCLIEMQNGETFLKQFAKRTEKDLICRQLNPPKDWKRSISEIKAIHAVVGRG